MFWSINPLLHIPLLGNTSMRIFCLWIEIIVFYLSQLLEEVLQSKQCARYLFYISLKNMVLFYLHCRYNWSKLWFIFYLKSRLYHRSYRLVCTRSVNQILQYNQTKFLTYHKCLFLDWTSEPIWVKFDMEISNFTQIGSYVHNKEGHRIFFFSIFRTLILHAERIAGTARNK